MTTLATFGKGLGWLAAITTLLLSGPLLTLAFGNAAFRGDWRTATHRSAGIAPEAAAHPEAIVQVYASRTFGWRGAFAVHTWVAAKPAGAPRYTRYEVIGWRAMGGGSALSVSDGMAPDAEWYGAAPVLIGDLRGADADAVIAKLPAAAQSYPYARRYSAWPGPNSNTFIAHLGREIPEMRLDLPSIAIGKDYLPTRQLISVAPSGTGWQLSLAGLVGVTAARVEGLEINVLGLVAGVDFLHPAIKFPGVARIPGGL